VDNRVIVDRVAAETRRRPEANKQLQTPDRTDRIYRKRLSFPFFRTLRTLHLAKGCLTAALATKNSEQPIILTRDHDIPFHHCQIMQCRILAQRVRPTAPGFAVVEGWSLPSRASRSVSLETRLTDVPCNQQADTVYILRPTVHYFLHRIYASHFELPNSTPLLFTMFHVVFSLTSRFPYLRNILQGLAHGILALRSLDAISSHLTPALSPPPPVPLLEAPVPFQERPEQIISPYPSRGVIAIQRQFPVSASPFPI
jgi:hypothetical protein